MKKQNFKTIFWSLSSLLLITGLSMGFILKYESSFNNPVIDNQELLTIKRTSSITNSDGTETQSFVYSINPENATNQNVILTAKFIDGTSCDEYITYNSNTDEKTISVTCLKDFSKQILLEVMSESNNSITKTIKIDYEKKLLSISDSGLVIGLGGNPENCDVGPNVSLTTWSYENAVKYLIDTEFSEYTIDKNYTFNFNFKNCNSDEEFLPSNGEYVELISMYFAQDVLENFNTPTADKIWSILDTNDYHSWLKQCASYDGTGFSLIGNVEVTCNEVPSISISFEYTFCLGLNFDFDEYYISVDSLNTEVDSLVF